MILIGKRNSQAIYHLGGKLLLNLIFQSRSFLGNGKSYHLLSVIFTNLGNKILFLANKIFQFVWLCEKASLASGDKKGVIQADNAFSCAREWGSCRDYRFMKKSSSAMDKLNHSSLFDQIQPSNSSSLINYKLISSRGLKREADKMF